MAGSLHVEHCRELLRQKSVLEPNRGAVAVLLWAALASLALSTLFLGTYWGFPQHDDVYLIRLLRAGGPDLIAREHPDRPVVGRLIAASARVAGERPAIYAAIALVGWTILAAESACLWVLLFPQWPDASCVVALAVLAPIVNRVQFTTLTTTVPCTLPVVLVLAALILLLRRPAGDVGYFEGIVAVILVAAAGSISEYALATVIGASALALVMGRRRPILWLGSGSLVGYLVFRMMSDVTLRKSTDPDLQLSHLLERPWSPPFKDISGLWFSIVGAWGRAASAIGWDWSSKSTILAALAGILSGAITAALVARCSRSDPAGQVGRPLLALSAAVAVGLSPVVIIHGWPPQRLYENRFQLPILAFASCLTVALVMVLTRANWRAVALGALAFVAADQLVLGAADLRRSRGEIERFGRRLLPIVQHADGVVVLVVSEANEANLVLMTRSWPPADAARFWLERPTVAEEIFGPRARCPDLATLPPLPRTLRWIPPQERITKILWASGSGVEPLEPYFIGCLNR